MPEHDLPELDGFGSQSTSQPSRPMLPAAEIRRRGDRRRRRRTGLVAGAGALAVVLAVGGPILAFGGTDAGDDVQPAPRPTRTDSPTEAPTDAPRDVVTAVPAGFPLDAGPGFEDGSWTPLDDTVALYVCGADAWVQPVDSMGATMAGGETNEERELAVYADDDTAAAALSGIGTGVAECPTQDVGEGEFTEPRPMDSSLGEDSVAYLDQYGDGDGPNGEGLAVVVTRVGNALLMHRSYLIGGADDLSFGQKQVDRIVTDAAPVVEAMCVFAAEPCSPSDSPASPDSSGGTDIPEEFELAQGIEYGVDEEVSGPSKGIDGVSFADLCDTAAWPGDGSTDRLAVRVTGPEYGLVRELRTYASADQAVAVVDGLGAALAACPEAPDGDGDPGNDWVFTGPLDADTGYDSSLTFAMTSREGRPGGAIFQVVRVGRAVLAVVTTGEYGPDSVELGVPTLTTDNREVTALMCPWTEAGC